MNNDIQGLKDDISFLKDLVKDDGTVLAASGIGLMVVGIVFGLAGLRSFALGMGWLEMPALWSALMPWDAVAAFWIVLIALFIREHKRVPQQAPSKSASSRAMWAGWAAVGFGHLAADLGLSQAGLGDLAMVTIFAFWGGGWLVMFGLYRRLWFAIVAVACYGVAVGMGALEGSEYDGLLLALAFLLLIAAPGYALLREARAAV